MRPDLDERPPALDLSGEAFLETPAGILEIHGRGPALVLETPSVQAALTLLPRSFWRRRRTLRRLTLENIRDVLSRADVTVELTVDGKTLARFGPAARPSWIALALGLPVEAPLRRVLLCLLARRTPTASP